MNSRKGLRNAIAINFSNLMFSGSVRLINLLFLSLATVFAFWPSVNETILKIPPFTASILSSDRISILMICSGLMLMLTLLITRIGAHIGFQKGSKVTEIILTSISPQDLFAANLISSLLMIIVTLTIVTTPLILGGWIPAEGQQLLLFRTFNLEKTLVGFHLILVVVQLIILAIAVCSRIKRSEDTGPYLLVVIFPFIFSHFYFSISGGLYEGLLYGFNFISVFSLIPSIGASFNGSISVSLATCMILSDIVFIVLLSIGGRKMFVKHITQY